MPTQRNLLYAAAVLLAAAAAWFWAGGSFGNARSDQLSVQTTSGTHRFTIEWARTNAERARGLMERTDLPQDHGMLFDFERETEVSFWMKNTPLPLDMIFIKADGTVYRIEHRTTPYSETMIPSGARIRYVLEVNGGVASRIGLQPGDRFRIPDPPAPPQ